MTGRVSWLHPVTRRAGDDGERGSLTIFTAVLAVALLAMAGLVIDGTGKLTAARHANAIAEEAARAGADTIDAAQLRAGGSIATDPTQAVTAAEAYLAAAQVTGTVTAPAPDRIRVTVTLRRPTDMLGLVGIHSYTVTGHATAALEAGR